MRCHGQSKRGGVVRKGTHRHEVKEMDFLAHRKWGSRRNTIGSCIANDPPAAAGTPYSSRFRLEYGLNQDH